MLRAEIGPAAITAVILLLAPIVIVGIIVWSYWSVLAESRKAADNLRALAQRLGLTYQEKGIPRLTDLPAVGGAIANREVRFYRFTTGSGKSRRDWRAAAVYPRKTGALTFDLHRQGFGSKFEALFGAKEAVVGDPAFDAEWFLRTNRPEFLGAALGPEVRSKMMSAEVAGGRHGNFKLEHGFVRYAEIGSLADAAACVRLERMLPLLQDLADIAEVDAGGAA